MSFKLIDAFGTQSYRFFQDFVIRYIMWLRVILGMIEKKREEKLTPIIWYRNEWALANLMLITVLRDATLGVLLPWEVGSKIILVISIQYGVGTWVCLLSSFLLLRIPGTQLPYNMAPITITSNAF